ncbi:MAG: hypothetical protein ACI87E_002075 [Mariniblastus sp.]
MKNTPNQRGQGPKRVNDSRHLDCFPRPSILKAVVNGAQNEAELNSIVHSLQKNSPFGIKAFVNQFAVRWKLEHTLRSREIPKKYQ